MFLGPDIAIDVNNNDVVELTPESGGGQGAGEGAGQQPTAGLPSGLPTGLSTGMLTGFPTGMLTGLPTGLPTGMPTGLPTNLENQDPGFNWFQQWATGNGASPQPTEGETAPEDENRLNLPTEPTSSSTEGMEPSPTEGNTQQAGGGDYCALDASHTMCKFKVAADKAKLTEVLRPMSFSSTIIFQPQLF